MKTASTEYMRKLETVEDLLRHLGWALSTHRGRSEQAPREWSFASDLDRVIDALRKALATFEASPQHTH